VPAHHRQRHVHVVRTGQVTRRPNKRVVIKDVENSGDRDQDVVLGDLGLFVAFAAPRAATAAALASAAVATAAAVAAPAVVIVVAAVLLVTATQAIVATLPVVVATLPVVIAAVLLVPATQPIVATLPVVVATPPVTVGARAVTVPLVATVAALTGAALALATRPLAGGLIAARLISMQPGSRAGGLGTLCVLRGGHDSRQLVALGGSPNRFEPLLGGLARQGTRPPGRSVNGPALRGRATALRRFDRIDQLALAHATGSRDAEAASELLQLGQHHAVQPRSAATPARRGLLVLGGLGCIGGEPFCRGLGCSEEISVSHSGSFPWTGAGERADALITPGGLPPDLGCTYR
jgi:hypothetical protein